MPDLEILKLVEEGMKEIDEHADLLDPDLIKILKEDFKKFKNDINIPKKSD